MKGNHLPIFALVIDYAMQLSMRRRRVDLEGSRLASSVERNFATLYMSALPSSRIHTCLLFSRFSLREIGARELVETRWFRVIIQD